MFVLESVSAGGPRGGSMEGTGERGVGLVME